MTPQRQELYLDCNATTPLLPAARAAALQAMAQDYGNPSSSHCAGLRASAMVRGVRLQAMRLLGVGRGELLFVSGATEGIQTAVLSALCALRARRDGGEIVEGPLLVGATEHKAVPQSLAHWNTLLGLNLPLVEIPVDRFGRHDLAFLRAHAPSASMVCTMAANNETGVVSDLNAIAAVLAQARSRAYWLVDCVQALGKIPLDLGNTRIDYAPFSGHKLYAPKGIGMLYVRAGAPFTPLMVGGGQEGSLRAGTENTPGIAALGAVLNALEAGQGGFQSSAYLEQARQRLAQALRRALPGVEFNMPFEGSLPTTLNFSVPGLTSKALLNLFDAAGLRISAGSACSAAKAEPSFVLTAMGLPQWQTVGAARLSIGALVDDAFIEEVCARIAKCGEALRESAAPSVRPPRLLERAPVADQVTRSGVGVDVGAGVGAANLTVPLDCASGGNLHALALPDFFAHHPNALLVDVREVFEHHAGPHGLPWQGPPAVCVPLDSLAQYEAPWLADHDQPLVFFCRSGNRSGAAVQTMRQRGHRQVWQLEGGLAMA